MKIGEVDTGNTQIALEMSGKEPLFTLIINHNGWRSKTTLLDGEIEDLLNLFELALDKMDDKE